MLLDKGFSPDKLKCAEVVPVYKNKDKKDNNSYRPVCILSNISKLYKRCYINKSLNILNHFYQSFNAVLDKDSVH